MNICIISQRYPYKDNMEFVFVKKIVDEWAKDGHRCVVITTMPWATYFRGHIKYKPSYYRYEVAAGNYVEVYNPRYINTGFNIAGVALDQWMAAGVIEKQLIRLKIKFDFIYCHFFCSGLKGFRYAKTYKIPFFIATGESEIEPLLKPFPRFRWEDFRLYTNGVISVSSKNKTEAAKLGYIDEAKCQVFPNGTDIRLFKPLCKAECRNKLGLPQNTFIVSCVGFICERKGQNRLLEAVRRLSIKNIKLMFIGATAPVESFPLEGDEILFKGPVENKSLPDYLCASDIFCLPTRAEGCCNAIIEALACGLPVISSNKPFNWDVLDESNSILINPDSSKAISDAIIQLYNDAEKCKELSEGALRMAKSLDIHQRAENILSFIVEHTCCNHEKA